MKNITGLNGARGGGGDGPPKKGKKGKANELGGHTSQPTDQQVTDKTNKLRRGEEQEHGKTRSEGGKFG